MIFPSASIRINAYLTIQFHMIITKISYFFAANRSDNWLVIQNLTIALRKAVLPKALVTVLTLTPLFQFNAKKSVTRF